MACVRAICWYSTLTQTLVELLCGLCEGYLLVRLALGLGAALLADRQLALAAEVLEFVVRVATAVLVSCSGARTTAAHLQHETQGP